MREKFIIPSLFLLPFANLSYSQSDSLDYYFDDGGLSRSKNVFKLNTTAIISGEFLLYYERVFDKGISIEVGGGFWMGEFLGQHIHHLPSPVPFRNLTPSFSGQFRWYYPGFNSAPPHGLFSGLWYRYRFVDYSVETSHDYDGLDIHEFMFVSGLSVAVGDRFLLEGGVGLGLSLYDLSLKPVITHMTNQVTYRPTYNVSIKLGYKI